MDLTSTDIDSCFDQIDVIVHLAALPGLVLSWSHFDDYMTNNILATQRLIDASMRTANPHFIFASSSSVYGAHAVGDETLPLNPISPYGVTKVAGEQLLHAYSEAIPSFSYTILRYFSVYGPRQRPDMAYAKMCQSLLQDTEITVTGTGKQTRSNTFIDDAVRATLLTIKEKPNNVTLNICGDEEINVLDAIQIMASALNKTPKIHYVGARHGDQVTTRGDWNLAHNTLGWKPLIDPREGLTLQALAAKSDAH
jgi:nucleoside-diphosphate-sugar epimerase